MAWTSQPASLEGKHMCDQGPTVGSNEIFATCKSSTLNAPITGPASNQMRHSQSGDTWRIIVVSFTRKMGRLSVTYRLLDGKLGHDD